MNQALSRVLPVPQTALQEREEGRVEVWKRAAADAAFELVESRAGNFDSLDWTEFLPADVFISPGIDPRRKFFSAVSDSEVRELDFFCRHFRGFKIGITGTDGKSTLTSQLGQVVKWLRPDVRVFVGGNLGTAMAEAISGSYDIAILEVSSFQAERLKTAELDLGILINFAIDHQDRYPGLDEYFEAKVNLLRHAKSVIYPEPIEVGERRFRISEDVVAKRLPFNFSNNAALEDILSLVAEHLSRLWGAPLPSDWIRQLPRLPHRLEIFVEAEKDLWLVNDSKATTVHAALYGYLQMRKKRRRVIWLIGGRDKGDDFSVIPSQVRASDQVIIFGEARERIRQFVPNSLIYSNLEEALSQTLPKLKSGDALLLSPACSSYDEFHHFEERGEYFLKRCGEVFPTLTKESGL